MRDRARAAHGKAARGPLRRVIRSIGLCIGLGIGVGAGLGSAIPTPARAEAPLRLTPGDAAAQEAVRNARLWQLRKAQEAGITPGIATARQDLDGDGLPEIIAVLQAPQRCAALGLRNCPLIILHQSAPGRFHEVGSFFGDSARLLDSRSQGWLDLETRFTQGPWRRTTWTGAMYRLRR
ncbi:hypothetical protein [Teichococcus cervicalis]|uniref:FG-GAP repeat protein n=1 Tax=Pseudoroseomonas cervicalis ATCC 49957 TaxID=525371 RepID=D5RGP7_9PROT|nr:hypothetical protein [Pseudoroseomonas cervicalis]EFH13527.1 hypothetical protein HMPREF0731_0256 [Pseudoroseomonas cervicalis ATCC 49957]